MATIDAIPDAVPVAGFCDDLGVLVLVLAAVSQFVTPGIRKQAKDRLDKLFGTSLGQ